MTAKAIKHEKSIACRSQLRAIHDTLELINGKWKISVIASLSFLGKCRFMELQREVDGVGAKMLSQVLKELEENQLINRQVFDTKPVTVEYSLTDYGRTLQRVINEMAEWGANHRKKILE
ncbi:transcriptional regulator [Pedobacter sp. HMF7056]|uniref:Transcriptional regulator n=2 Tax=Hufsiella ginkgonis TaxID=2695274 RepID=A0A7K1Y1V8_9SPHI|nr:transcriptional regulator [Hufsiella ginkgonis]